MATYRSRIVRPQEGCTGHPLSVFTKKSQDKLLETKECVSVGSTDNTTTRNMLRDLYQAECDHRFCKGCVDIIKAMTLGTDSEMFDVDEDTETQPVGYVQLGGARSKDVTKKAAAPTNGDNVTQQSDSSNHHLAAPSGICPELSQLLSDAAKQNSGNTFNFNLGPVINQNIVTSPSKSDPKPDPGAVTAHVEENTNPGGVDVVQEINKLKQLQKEQGNQLTHHREQLKVQAEGQRELGAKHQELCNKQEDGRKQMESIASKVTEVEKQASENTQSVSHLEHDLTELGAEHQKLCDKQEYEKKQAEIMMDLIASDVTKVEKKVADLRVSQGHVQTDDGGDLPEE